MSRTEFTTRFVALAAFVAFSALALPLHAYDLIRGPNGAKVTWEDGTIPLLIKLPTAPFLDDGSTYATSVQAAASAWSAHLARVQFNAQNVPVGPAGSANGLNEIVFDSRLYSNEPNSEAFGANVLAVTISYRSEAPRADGSFRRTQADILFNSAYAWNSYRGGIRSPIDIRRVAVHELGHVLGLAHPDQAGQTVSALMNSAVSDVAVVQQDDINGAQFLYGKPGGLARPANDAFTDATPLMISEGSGVVVNGTTIGASRELGEPSHAALNAGGASSWWRWTAPATGTVSVSTEGSHFDTLLAAYSGNAVNALTQLASNHDASALTRTSAVSINVVSGRVYYFAVDGHNGEWGLVRLALLFTPNYGAPAGPQFTVRPRTDAVMVGGSVTFTAAAAGSSPLAYQWSRNGEPIAGATGATLSLSNVGRDARGYYEVAASNAAGVARSYFHLHVYEPGLAVGGWGNNSVGQLEAPAGLFPVVAVAGGFGFSIALKPDGTVVGWGGSQLTAASPPAGLTDVVAIAAQGSTSMALKRDGTVAVWGTTVGAPAGLTDVIAIASGGSHCLAVKSDGSVVAWGLNTWGATSVPAALRDVVAVAAGQDHSAALRSDGGVSTWGQNINYEKVAPPADLSRVVSLTSGAFHLVARRADGGVAAWGMNYSGQTTVPAGASPAVGISAGNSHSMALAADGTLRMWGDNFYGQLTPPSWFTTARSAVGAGGGTLVLVPPVAPVITSEPGDRVLFLGQTLALDVAAVGVPTPTLRWRKNGVELEDGGRIAGARTRSLRVSALEAVDAGTYDVVVTNVAGMVQSRVINVQIALPPQFTGRPPSRNVQAGSSVTLSAPASGGASYEWRRNGQLLSATDSTLQLSSVSLAERGRYEVSATNSAGTTRSVFYVHVAVPSRITAWGSNAHGQIDAPAGTIDLAGVSAGADHTLVVRGDGTVLAWGRNDFGQTTVPPGLSGVVQVAAGGAHSLALTAAGQVVAWGNNQSGQCNVPANLDSVVWIAAGGAHSVALKSDGTLVSWGANEHGQSTPPAGSRFYRYVDAGPTHTVALADDSAIAWGANGHAQSTLDPLGAYAAIAAGENFTVWATHLGTVVSKGALSIPANLANVETISAGNGHVLALTRYGTVAAFGVNNTGQAAVPPAVGNVHAVAAGGSHSVALIRPVSPVIYLQPDDHGALIGETVTLSVGASGATSYRWMRNGTDLVDGVRISGAASTTLTLREMDASMAGQYSVRASNAFGETVSAVATVSVVNFVVANRAAVVSADGEQVTLSVSATGAGPFTYQWFRGSSGDTSVPVVGATESSLAVPHREQLDSYWVRVTAGALAANSRTLVAGKWKLIDPAFGRAEMHATAFGNGRHVIVGDRAGYSDNGVDWRVASLPSGAQLRSVIHDGTRFVAAGRGGVVVASVDGKTWMQLRASDGPQSYEQLSSGARGNGVTVFVGADNKVMTSTDGVAWTWRPVLQGVEHARLLSVAFGAGRFVAVGNTQAGPPRIYTSVDGINWAKGNFSLVSSNPSYAFSTLLQVRFIGGSFVAFGSSEYSGAPAYVLTSTDGLTWSAPVFTNIPVSVDSLAYGGGRFLSADFCTSLDGINWQAPASRHFQHISGLGYGNGMFLAIKTPYLEPYASVATSADALAWETRVGIGAGGLAVHGGGQFITFKQESRANSADGVNWTSAPFPLRYLTGAAYGGGQFIVWGQANSATSEFYTSSDGRNWSPRPSTVVERSFMQMLYVNGTWYARNTVAIYRSSDAVEWTLVHSDLNRDIQSFAFGNGRFIAVGGGGHVLVSDDGSNWARGTLPTDRHFYRVAAGGGMFVAVDRMSGIWSSTDGLQWTQRSLPTGTLTGSDRYIAALSYAQGMFHALHGPDWIVSLDGVTWQVQTNTFAKERSDQLALFSAEGFAWATVGPQWLRSPGAGLPELVSSPASAQIAAGNAATLTVAATGTNLSYQWFLGSTGDTSNPIAGATSATFATPALTQTSHYWVRIFNEAGAISSGTVTVSIGAPPSIVNQPADTDTRFGTVAHLSVGVSGASPLNFQWYRGITGDVSNPIADTNSGGYFTPTHAAAVERYWVRVSNPFGAIDSRAAVVTPWRERLSVSGDDSNTFLVNNRYFTPNMWSPDGIEWQSLGQGSPGINNMAFANGIYVGRSQASFYTSLDGATWTFGMATSYGRGLAYGAGRFVAGADIGSVFISTNGTSWSTQPLGASVSIQSVLHDGMRFIAAGGQMISGAASAAVMLSSDGLAWSNLALPANNTPLTRVVRAGSRYFAFTDTPGVVFGSANGTEWTRLAGLPELRFKSAIVLHGRYILGTDGAQHAVSTDGQQWTTRANPAGVGMRALFCRDGLAVAIGENAIHVSVDGDHWHLRAGTHVGGGAIGFGGGLFLLSGSQRAQFTSENAARWTRMPNGVSGQTINGFAFGNGRYLAIEGYGSAKGVYWTSTDAQTWQSRTIPQFSDELVNIQWANGQFFALGHAGQFATSADGLSWTLRSVGEALYLGSVAFGNGRYVIGTAWKAFASSDLVNWTTVSVWAGRVLFGKGLFVAATNGKISTSSDGLSWTERYFSQNNGSTEDFAFDGERFVGVGGTHLLISTDGMNWKPGPAVSAHRIATGNGMFVAGTTHTPIPAKPQAPAITVQPCSFAVTAGQPVALYAESDDETASYQWRRFGQVIPGATSPLLQLPLVLGGDAGLYDVVVSNAAGASTSTPASLNVVRLRQTITFEAIADREFSTNGIPLVASASSGLPVTFSVVEGSATVAEATLHLTGAGVVRVRAVQDGAGLYEPAMVERLFNVSANRLSWRTLSFRAQAGDDAIAGANADPDGDGMPNLLEYALGTNPLAVDGRFAPDVEVRDDVWSFSYTRPADRPDLVYEVEVSTNLQSWTTQGVTHEWVAFHGDRVEWRATHSRTTGPLFFRLKVTSP